MIKTQKVQVDWSKMPKGITWYFIGAPKTRKTTVASEWSEKGADGVLIIDTDLGTDFVENANRISVTSLNPPMRVRMLNGLPALDKDGKQIVEVVPPLERGFHHRTGALAGTPMEVYSLAEVVYDLLENFREYNVDTVAIDTVDMVNEWIEYEISPDGMGTKGYGTDWSQAKTKNMDIMLKLQQLIKKEGADLILISHSKKSTEVDGKVQLMPDLPSGLAGKMCAKADVIGYTTIDKKTGDAYMSFVGYDERSVGSRLRPLSGRNIKFSYEAIRQTIIGYKE